MKTPTLFSVIIAVLLSASVSAQETIHETVWFDSNWNPSSKEKATYYRPSPKPKKGGFWIVDYYMNGTKQMEGFSANMIVNNEEFDGLVVYFFEDGVVYQEVNYVDGKIQGSRKIYFESGALKMERNYEGDKKEGRFAEFYETGELLAEGNYEDNLREGVWKTYYKSGKIKERGKYEKGEKIGVWKNFYKNVYKR